MNLQNNIAMQQPKVPSSLLEADLDIILSATMPIWSEFKNARIFLSGGTGFIGSWVLESFKWANEKCSLGASIVVLTRNPEAFKQKCPHLADCSSIQFISGDVRDFVFPEGEWTHIIHAATDASADLNANNPTLMLDVILTGTKRMLEFALQSTKKPQFLFISSGAVYGKQPENITHVSEDYEGNPDIFNKNNAYSVGKRTAEHMCFLYHQQYGLDIKMARCFAFVGPYLPLDIHYAIGNFIRDSLKGGPINITGDGSPYRSYQYAADLMIWLWTILSKGKSCYPYNVGSDEAFSIADIAKIVAQTFNPAVEVTIAKKPDVNKKPERYIPSVQRALSDLQLENKYSLIEAIKKTKEWYGEKSS